MLKSKTFSIFKIQCITFYLSMFVLFLSFAFSKVCYKFFINIFYQIEEVIYSSYVAGSCYHKWVLNCVKWFSASMDKINYYIYIVDYIDIFFSMLKKLVFLRCILCGNDLLSLLYIVDFDLIIYCLSTFGLYL